MCWYAVEGDMMGQSRFLNIVLVIPVVAIVLRTSAPYQHFAIAVFRAVENRVFIARAANTGITGFIDPSGRILKQGGIFKEEAMNGTIRLSKQKTFYTLYGDVFAWVCFAFSLFLLELPSFKSEKRKDRSNPGKGPLPEGKER